MNKKIYPYPTCSSLTAEKLLFSCRSNQNQLDLEYVDEFSIHILNADVDSAVNPLTVRIELTFKNLQELFSGNAPVASPGSRLGVAVQLKFVDLSVSKMIPANNSFFSSDAEDETTFIWEETFQPGDYFGDIEFLPVIYVVEAQADEASVFARSKGTILGYLNSCRRILNLNKSQHGMFSVITKDEEKTAPLWRIRINSNDEDDFADSFQLILNKNNLAFPLLYLTPTGEMSPLLFEILAESFRIFVSSVLKLVNDDEGLDAFLAKTDYPVTSVGANAIYLMKNALFELKDDFYEQSDCEKSLSIRKILMNLYRIGWRKEIEA